MDQYKQCLPRGKIRIWPYDSFEIDTRMSAESIFAVLNDKVEPSKWFRLPGNHKTFQGTIDSGNFKITRIIHYRNSFLPVIKGTFRPGSSEITVAIEMCLHPFVAAFMCVWFGGVSLGIIAVLASLLTGQTEVHPMLLIPFGMLLFGWALVSGAFWFEVNKTKPILVEMFNGTLKSELTPPSREGRDQEDSNRFPLPRGRGLG